MGYLFYQPQNAHRVEVDGRHLLFHIPTTSLFEIDRLDNDVIDLFADRTRVSEADVRERFEGRADPDLVTERIRSLLPRPVHGRSRHAEDSPGLRAGSPATDRRSLPCRPLFTLNPGTTAAPADFAFT